jgi:thiamine-phosphate pyrophosphorylase
MKCDNTYLALYAVTDSSWLGTHTLYEDVESALKGGATCIQLREKDMPEDELETLAHEIMTLCHRYDRPFILNDNVDVAVKVHADGVHVGQHDMEASLVREKIGPNMLLGLSAQTVEQAVAAEKAGADYLGVGAVFPTDTKKDADAVSYETLQQICKAVSIPVIAIGGIGVQNIAQLKGSGIVGVAVVSAIFAQENIQKATEALVETVHTELLS